MKLTGNKMQVQKKKKKIKPLAKRQADEYSKYWKVKLQEVFWGYVDLIQPDQCAIGYYMGETCSLKIDRHHLIRRNHKEFEYDINNIIKLCATHHKYSTKCSAHKAPLEFSYWLQKTYPKRWGWFVENRNRITQKYERESYKQLYNKYLKLIKETL